MTALDRASNRLKLAHRDVRVARTGIRPASRMVPESRTGRLARTIAQRYGGRQERWSGLGLVFRRPQAGVLWQPVYHQTRWHPSASSGQALAPRLALTVLAPQVVEIRPPDGIAPQQAPAGFNPGRWFERETVVHSAVTRLQPVILKSLAPLAGSAPLPRSRSVIAGRVLAHQRVETTTTEELVRRMVARGQRIEPVGPGRPPARQSAVPVVRQPGRVTGPAPVPQIVHRPAGAVVDDGTPRALSQARAPATNGSLPPAGQPAPLDFSQLDVGRLTDQVVRTIDERMIAHRERMGRM